MARKTRAGDAWYFDHVPALQEGTRIKEDKQFHVNIEELVIRCSASAKLSVGRARAMPEMRGLGKGETAETIAQKKQSEHSKRDN